MKSLNCGQTTREEKVSWVPISTTSMIHVSCTRACGQTKMEEGTFRKGEKRKRKPTTANRFPLPLLLDWQHVRDQKEFLSLPQEPNFMKNEGRISSA